MNFSTENKSDKPESDNTVPAESEKPVEKAAEGDNTVAAKIEKPVRKASKSKKSFEKAAGSEKSFEKTVEGEKPVEKKKWKKNEGGLFGAGNKAPKKN